MQRIKHRISNGQEAYREYSCSKVGTVIVPRDKHLTGCWLDPMGYSQDCNRMEMFSLLECMRYYVTIKR